MLQISLTLDWYLFAPPVAWLSLYGYGGSRRPPVGADRSLPGRNPVGSDGLPTGPNAIWVAAGTRSRWPVVTAQTQPAPSGVRRSAEPTLWCISETLTRSSELSPP